MTEGRESWREFNQRLRARGLDFSKSEERLVAIGIIYEIVSKFIDPTAEVMLPVPHEHPPGGRDYSSEHWVAPGLFDWDVEQAYGDAFGGSWSPPPEREVVSLLAEYGLGLRSADAAPKLHHSWIGGEAGAGVNWILAGLRAAVEADRETPQRREEFVRLAPLLDRSLPTGVVDTLSMLLFELSSTLGHEEAARRRDSSDRYVAQRLQMDARSYPIDDGAVT